MGICGLSGIDLSYYGHVFGAGIRSFHLPKRKKLKEKNYLCLVGRVMERERVLEDDKSKFWIYFKCNVRQYDDLPK